LKHSQGSYKIQMKNVSKRLTQSNILFWSSIIILLLASYWWRVRVLGVFPFEYDEGIHLIIGQLWAAGYTPYDEIFVSYPPSFLWSLGIPWKLFKQAAALQLLMATYALAGVLAVIYLGVAYRSRLAGLVAGLFLSFTPAYFIPSVAIMTETPSISLAVVAVALAERYRRSGGWVYALLAGAALGFGLSLKLLPYYALPLVGLMAISRHSAGISLTSQKIGPHPNPLPVGDGTATFPSPRGRGAGGEGHFHPLEQSRDFMRTPMRIEKIAFRDLLLLAGGFIAVFLFPAFLFNTTALYEQNIGMRLASRAVEYNPFDSNNDTIIEFLFGNAGLLALAGYGFVFVVARNLRSYWPLLVWFVLVWMSMLFLSPLRDKHLPIFLPLLALFAAFGVDHIFNFFKQTGQQSASPRFAAMALAAILVAVIFVWNMPQVIAQNNGDALNVEVNEERLAAVGFINQIATPADCVIADNPIFLYQTGRLPPPELSETSQTRVDTGYLTAQDVIEAIERDKCHVVAIVTPRFGESLPGLAEWLAGHYLGLHAQSETFVYFAPKNHLVDEKGLTPVNGGVLGDIAQLYGYKIAKQADAIYISLFWQLQTPIATRYTEQLTLRDGAGNTAYQLRRVPFEGQFNPATWQVGEKVRDTLRFDMPADTPPGVYNLYLSLCVPATDECLPLDRPAGIELGQINVIGRSQN
jgi:hypothetical protein